MNQETKIQRLIMLALSENGCIVWRNETGSFWAGSVIHKTQDQVTLANARMVPCGLCVGSADIVGIYRKTGQFLAIEVKTSKGRPTKEQINFIEQVRAAGGISGIARSPSDALELLPR